MNDLQFKAKELCGIDLSCKLTSMVVDGEDQIRYTTYGMIVTDDEGNTVEEFPDISTDRSYVEKFIEICETRNVCSFHIDDILYDYLP